MRSVGFLGTGPQRPCKSSSPNGSGAVPRYLNGKMTTCFAVEVIIDAHSCGLLMTVERGAYGLKLVMEIYPHVPSPFTTKQERAKKGIKIY